MRTRCGDRVNGSWIDADSSTSLATKLAGISIRLTKSGGHDFFPTLFPGVNLMILKSLERNSTNSHGLLL